MKNRLVIGLNALALGVAAMLWAPPVVAIGADDATEDILHMLDGRELHGRILEETRDAIVFEVNISGIISRVTFPKSEIGRVDRDVELTAEETEERRVATRGEEDDEKKDSFGARRVYEESDVASFYIVPMKGQMGTDVNIEAYRPMVDDIRAANPDYLVIKVECADTEERLYPRIPEQERGLNDANFLDMYRDLVNFFHDELRDQNQIVWIVDSIGISSLIALSWDDIYMSPDGHLGGLGAAAIHFERVKGDADMYGKFREAYMGWMRGFVENSGHDTQLVDAMVRPEVRLSATWKGRDVDWSLDADGEYIVDNSEGATANFRARDAENFCISSGTVEDLDDLALLIGLREYRVLDGAAESMYQKYVDDWRRAWDQAKSAMEEYQKITEYGAGPSDPAQSLGRQKSLLERVLSYMDRYDAVRVRAAFDYGITKIALQVRIDLLKEQLRAMRRSNRDSGRRSAPGGGGLGGGG